MIDTILLATENEVPVDKCMATIIALSRSCYEDVQQERRKQAAKENAHVLEKRKDVVVHSIFTDEEWKKLKALEGSKKRNGKKKGKFGKKKKGKQQQQHGGKSGNSRQNDRDDRGDDGARDSKQNGKSRRNSADSNNSQRFRGKAAKRSA